MRTRILLGIVSLGLIFASQNLMGKKTSLPSKLSVRQQVDSEIDNLKKNLKAAKSQDGKWGFLEKTVINIKTLRLNNSRQFEGDEVYMGLLQGSLQEIPARAKFNREKCSLYRAEIISNFNPAQEKEPNEAVTQTLGVLEILCRVPGNQKS